MLTPYFIMIHIDHDKHISMVKKQTFLCNLLKSVGTEFGFKCGDFLVRFRNAFQNVIINPYKNWWWCITELSLRISARLF